MAATQAYYSVAAAAAAAMPLAGSPGGEPVTRARVVKAHNATDDAQLELAVGDMIYVLEKDASGWWGGHHDDEDVTGWFPGSCVRELLDDSEVTSNDPTTARRTPGGTGITGADCETARGGLEAPAGLSPGYPPRVMSVASPQGRINLDMEFSRASPAAASAEKGYQSFLLGSPEAPKLSLEDQMRELSRLRAENAELKSAKRQSDAVAAGHRKSVAQIEAVAAGERERMATLEASAASEREKAWKLEQKLQLEAEDKKRAAVEAEQLRVELQRTKRRSEAQLQEVQEKCSEFQKQLYAKDTQLRQSKEMLELAQSTSVDNIAAPRASLGASLPTAVQPAVEAPEPQVAMDVAYMRRSMPQVERSLPAVQATSDAPGQRRSIPAAALRPVAKDLVPAAFCDGAATELSGSVRPAFLGSCGKLVPSSGADESQKESERPRRGLVSEITSKFERSSTPIRRTDAGELLRASRSSGSCVSIPAAAPAENGSSWRFDSAPVVAKPAVAVAAVVAKPLDGSLAADDEMEFVLGMSPMRR